MKKTSFKASVILSAIAGIAITNTTQAQWSLTGNAGTVPGTNFVGTTDSKSLYFKTGNTNRLAITSGGKVGIGTTAPTAKFEIKAAGATYDIVRFYNDKDATLDSSMVLTKDGRLGIGTATPATRLEINGDITFSNGAARTIGVAQPTVNGSGFSLTVTGADAKPGPGGASGGSLTLRAGSAYDAGTGGGGFGGDVKLIGGGNQWGFSAPQQCGHIIFYTGVTPIERMRVDRSGNVLIGVATPATGYLLSVGGKIICTELKVQAVPFPDYVFEKNYRLNSLAEVEQHINEFKRLPGMPGACEVEDNGMDVGSMQIKLVEKIEELTLYIIDQQKQIDELKKQVNSSAK